jgi:hypothetical protein
MILKVKKESKMFVDISFAEWLLFSEMAVGGAPHTFLQKNPRKPDQSDQDFMVVAGNTFPVKDDLKSAGFQFYMPTKTWSIPRWKYKSMKPDLKVSLEKKGISFDPFDMPREQMLPQEAQEKTTDEQIKDDIEKIAKMSKNQQYEKLDEMLEKLIDDIGTMTDEAKKSQLVKDFLAIAAKLYQYSPRNQWLIFIQNPKATDVQSVTKWQKLGRRLKQGADKNKIAIFIPIVKKEEAIKLSQEEEERLKDPQIEPWEEIELRDKQRGAATVYGYKIGYVYDIQDTEAIPGAKAYDPVSYRTDKNEPVEELKGIVAALLNYASEKGIPVTFEGMDIKTGGFATKDKVVINNTFDGINKASVLIHELAHKFLHFGPERKSYRTKEEYQIGELEAESIASIVLNFFGFNPTTAPNYLALWRGDKKQIKARSETIKKGVQEFIKAIEKYYRDSHVHEDEFEQQETV